MVVGCVIFCMTHKKAKKYARDNDLQGWNDVVVWRDFKPPYIPGDIWSQYIEHVTSERFTRRLQSDADRCRQLEPANLWFGDHAHQRLHFVQCTCEADDKINLNEIYR